MCAGRIQRIQVEQTYQVCKHQEYRKDIRDRGIVRCVNGRSGALKLRTAAVQDRGILKGLCALQPLVVDRYRNRNLFRQPIQPLCGTFGIDLDAAYRYTGGLASMGNLHYPGESLSGYPHAYLRLYHLRCGSADALFIGIGMGIIRWASNIYQRSSHSGRRHPHCPLYKPTG